VKLAFAGSRTPTCASHSRRRSTTTGIQIGVGGFAELLDIPSIGESSLGNDMRARSAGEKEEVTFVFSDFGDPLPIVQDLELGKTSEDTLWPDFRHAFPEDWLPHPSHPPALGPIQHAGGDCCQDGAKDDGVNGHQVGHQKQNEITEKEQNKQTRCSSNVPTAVTLYPEVDEVQVVLVRERVSHFDSCFSVRGQAA
jgi:hypothetical protein